jgi:hypothetical protein
MCRYFNNTYFELIPKELINIINLYNNIIHIYDSHDLIAYNNRRLPILIIVSNKMIILDHHVHANLYYGYVNNTRYNIRIEYLLYNCININYGDDNLNVDLLQSGINLLLIKKIYY